MEILWHALVVVLAALGMFLIHISMAAFRHWLLYVVVVDFSVPIQTRTFRVLWVIRGLRLLSISLCVLFAITLIKFML